MPASPKRRFAAILVAASIAGGVLFAGGYWVAGRLNTSAQSSSAAAQYSQEVKTLVSQHSTELAALKAETSSLNTEIAKLNAGTKTVDMILLEAGSTSMALESQMRAICQATPNCTITLPPPSP